MMRELLRFFFINSNNQQINLTLPHIKLEEYSIIDLEKTKPSSYDDGEQASRFAKILKLLNFSNLNEEEKESLFPILFDYSQQFHLPGDKLGSAKAVTHKMITSDNKPVNPDIDLRKCTTAS